MYTWCYLLILFGAIPCHSCTLFGPEVKQQSFGIPHSQVVPSLCTVSGCTACCRQTWRWRKNPGAGAALMWTALGIQWSLVPISVSQNTWGCPELQESREWGCGDRLVSWLMFQHVSTCFNTFSSLVVVLNPFQWGIRFCLVPNSLQLSSSDQIKCNQTWSASCARGLTSGTVVYYVSDTIPWSMWWNGREPDTFHEKRFGCGTARPLCFIVWKY